MPKCFYILFFEWNVLRNLFHLIIRKLRLKDVRKRLPNRTSSMQRYSNAIIAQEWWKPSGEQFRNESISVGKQSLIPSWRISWTCSSCRAQKFTVPQGVGAGRGEGPSMEAGTGTQAPVTIGGSGVLGRPSPQTTSSASRSGLGLLKSTDPLICVLTQGCQPGCPCTG